MIINSDDKEHLVLIPANITKEKFLLNAKVIKGSYFYKRLESIYNALTLSTTNVEKKYKTYYSEYDDFYQFLYHKYPYLDTKTIEMIVDKTKSKRYVLLRGYMYELVDYNLQTLMEWNEDFIKIINKLLKAKLYEN